MPSRTKIWCANARLTATSSATMRTQPNILTASLASRTQSQNREDARVCMSRTMDSAEDARAFLETLRCVTSMVRAQGTHVTSASDAACAAHGPYSMTPDVMWTQWARNAVFLNDALLRARGGLWAIIITRAHVTRFCDRKYAPPPMTRPSRDIYRAMKKVEGYEVLQDTDNVLQWTLRAHADDCPRNLKKALKVSGAQHMTFSIAFPVDFPLKPPFVRLLAPEMCQMSGHVVTGGAICAEILTMTDSAQGWRPTISIDALFGSIIALMADGDPTFSSRRGATYSETAARASFERVAKRYKWEL